PSAHPPMKVAMTPAQRTDSKNARLRCPNLDSVIVFIRCSLSLISLFSSQSRALFHAWELTRDVGMAGRLGAHQTGHPFQRTSTSALRRLRPTCWTSGISRFLQQAFLYDSHHVTESVVRDIWRRASSPLSKHC